MLLIGIDDTDILGSKGTNQLAKAIAALLSDRWRCRRIVRHQLLDDPRVPYTSKNGSASILLEQNDVESVEELIDLCRKTMREWFIEGSDPGLCVAESIPESVVAFGLRAKSEFMTQSEAIALAKEHEIHLEGLGGTNDGVIGALAAVGLATTGNDGRIVQLGTDPHDLRGTPSVAELLQRGVEVRDVETEESINAGVVNLPKKLRPNLRRHRAVLYVERTSFDGIETLTAVKLP